MTCRPLFWASLFFSAGILTPAGDLPPACWGSLAAIALAGSILLSAISRGRDALAAALAMAAAGWACCGAFAAGAAGAVVPDDLIALVARHAPALERGCDLEGSLARPPRRVLHAAREGCAIDLSLDMRRVSIGKIDHPVRGRARLRLEAPCEEAALLASAWRRGDRVRAYARLREPRVFRTPGAFDARRHLRARGVSAVGSIKSSRLLSVRHREGRVKLRALRAVDRLRARLITSIEKAFPATRGGERGAAVASALLVGERGGLSPSDARRLQEAGLSHLLAVSGFNVAALAWLATALLRLTGASRRAGAVLSLPVLILYLLLNAEESSVARAVLMAVVALAARAGWLAADLRSVLGLAAIVLLAGSPMLAHDAGFQLTFVATLALILALPERGWPPGPLRALVGATIAAAVGTAPLSALHFNRICFGSLPANLAGGPLMSAAFLMVILLVTLAPISPAAATLTAAGVERLVDLTFAAGTAVASVPFMSYRRPTPGLPLLAGYAAGLALVLLASRLAARRSILAASLGAWACAAALLAIPLDTREAPRGLRVTALDVGQGDAILIESAGGGRLLVDAGGVPGGEFDVGERVVSRALWSLGIARLDVLAVTHADADHAGGSASIARNFPLREVWVPPGWTGSREPWPIRLSAALREKTWLREVRAGESLCLRGTCVRLLHPEREGDPGENDRSLVLEIRAPGGGALLMGDAGFHAEAALDGRLPPVRLLKVGHHGSRGASSAAFLDAVRPRLAIISCGVGNRFGHPHRDALVRIDTAGARIGRTDRDGTIEVDLLPRAVVLGRPLTSRRTLSAGGRSR